MAKNQKWYLGGRGSSPTLGHPAQGSSAMKISLPDVKTSGDQSYGRQKLLESQAVPLKRPVHRLTQIHSLWAPAPGHQIERPRDRNWIVWHQGKSWGAAFSQTEVLVEAIVPFLSPPPHRVTESQRWKEDTISETPSTSLTLFPWWFPEALTYPTFRPTQLFCDFSIWMACLDLCFNFS